MHTAQELEKKFWKALQSDRTLMLGLDGVEDGHVRPMTAQVEGDFGPIWVFTSTDNGLVKLVAENRRAIAAFTSKGHDLFASIKGELRIHQDRAVIDRLWNPFVAAWYPGGKDDPNLVLLRLDAERAEIWLNEASLIAGVKMLLGINPQKDYHDNVADVALKQGA